MKFVFFYCTLIALLLPDCLAYAQQNPMPLPLLSDAGSTPIPLGFDKNAVQFIFIKTSDTNYVPDGTCFSVSIKNIKFPKIFIPLPFVGRPTLLWKTSYYITAKHVLYDESGNLRQNMYLRVGAQKGGLDYLSLSSEIANGNLRVLTPTNTDVDIAILAGRVPTTNEIAKATQSNPQDTTSNLKLGSFKSSLVVNKGSLNANGIREGCEMFFVGLFTPFYGANENLPIYRFGHLAMLPDEPVPMGSQGRRDLMLMETGAYPGNSGRQHFLL